MIRIVSLHKAVLAGFAAALAWELVLRALLLAGAPVADIVLVLGQVSAPQAPSWLTWIAGMTLHGLVGMIWAVFYAYFFWSSLPYRPVWQGIIFSLIPWLLATLIVYPQLGAMLSPQPILHVDFLQLFAQTRWGERAGLLLGHLIFGAVLGALYTHPVGYRVGARPPMPAPRRRPRVSVAPRKARPRPDHAFMFATGIECSYPTIENRRWRRDQMAAAQHYRFWRTDFDLCVDLGLSHLRYGPPLHLTYPARGQYDWSFVDQVIAGLRERDLIPIIDLCHFGVPDWLESFQNPDLPEAFAAYAEAFAKRYPWVRLYTPVNEMYVCARLSALDGIWNEQRRDERSFVTAVRHLAKANVLMMQAILRQRPDAVFINSESGEFYQPSTPDPEIVRIAAFENERRFLPLDLLYSNPVSEGMRGYLRENGMSDEEYVWFQTQPTPPRAVLGVDYYQWNEKLIDTDGRAQSLGELFGWYVVAAQYWERYRRPLMHTETNHLDAREAPRWLWRQWYNVELIQKAGVPVVGFTWYSLTDQADWNIALTQALGNVNPVGLFDLNRDPRAVAQAYKYLISINAETPRLLDCPALRELLG